MYETLLEEHNLEADQLRNSLLLLQRRPMMSPPPESDVPLEGGEVDVMSADGGIDGDSDLMNWSEGDRSSRALVNWEELLEIERVYSLKELGARNKSGVFLGRWCVFFPFWWAVFFFVFSAGGGLSESMAKVSFLEQAGWGLMGKQRHVAQSRLVDGRDWFTELILSSS